MEDLVRGVKPLRMKRIKVFLKKVNCVKREVSVNEPFTPQKSFLQSMNRKKRRSFVYERSIDLHGFSRNRAFLLLLDFFVSCQNEGIRQALVITGGNALRNTVLRKSFRLWVMEDFGGFVASCTPANVEHGGEGAFYVLLKRKK